MKNKGIPKKEQELRTHAILKVIVGLRKNEGLTFKQIGEKFGFNTQYAATLYKRALREEKDKSPLAGLAPGVKSCLANMGVRNGPNAITEILHCVRRGKIMWTRNFGIQGYQKLAAWLSTKGIAIPATPPHNEESAGDAQAAREYFDKRRADDVAVIVEAISGDNVLRADLPTIVDDICKGLDRFSIMLIAERMVTIMETLEVIIDGIEQKDGRQIKKRFPYDYHYERTNTKHDGLPRSKKYERGDIVDWHAIRGMQSNKLRGMKEIEATNGPTLAELIKNHK